MPGRRRPRQQMEPDRCPRCQGLMVAVRLEDPGNRTTPWIIGHHCLMCGEITDPVIHANRIGYHAPVRDRTRPHYPAVSNTGKLKRITQ